jgi:thymidylate synthase (FAD)
LPQNKDLEPVNLPMTLRFDEAPTTEFLNDIDALTIELVDHPTAEQMRDVAWRYVKATWADDHRSTDPAGAATQPELRENLEDVLNFRALPTPMEIFSFTFKFAGIDLQTVTHLIRHRAGSFAAQCTGDRFLHHEPCLVPSAVENSPELYRRWKRHVDDAKQLYADMVDTRQISMMDARTVLPKCLSTFYYGRFNLKDIIGFVKQRSDKQIQPSIDNLIAAKMAREIIRVLPEASTVIGSKALTGPAWHYIKNVRAGTGTNLYWPDDDSDKHIEYHPNDTIYQAYRYDLNGTNPPEDESEGRTKFRQEWDSLIQEIQFMEGHYNEQKEKWNV